MIKKIFIVLTCMMASRLCGRMCCGERIDVHYENYNWYDTCPAGKISIPNGVCCNDIEWYHEECGPRREQESPMCCAKRSYFPTGWYDAGWYYGGCPEGKESAHNRVCCKIAEFRDVECGSGN